MLAWKRCEADPAAPKPMAPGNGATFLWRHAVDRGECAPLGPCRVLLLRLVPDPKSSSSPLAPNRRKQTTPCRRCRSCQRAAGRHNLPRLARAASSHPAAVGAACCGSARRRSNSPPPPSSARSLRDREEVTRVLPVNGTLWQHRRQEHPSPRRRVAVPASHPDCPADRVTRVPVLIGGCPERRTAVDIEDARHHLMDDHRRPQTDAELTGGRRTALAGNGLSEVVSTSPNFSEEWLGFVTWNLSPRGVEY